METISNEALAAARAKLDAAESRRENILLFHIANGVYCIPPSPNHGVHLSSQ